MLYMQGIVFELYYGITENNFRNKSELFEKYRFMHKH